jgi:hypothetical protein
MNYTDFCREREAAAERERARRLVGWVVISKPYLHRTNFEFAAWYQYEMVQPGVYPVYRDSNEVPVSMRGFSAPCRAIVVDKYTASHFGGVPIASSVPQGKQHCDVGKETTVGLHFSHEQLAKHMRGEYEFRAYDEATRSYVPVQVFVPNRAVTIRKTWHGSWGERTMYSPDYRMKWQGHQQYWYTSYGTTELKLLPARV